MAGDGTRDDPWMLHAAPGMSAYQICRDDTTDPPIMQRPMQAV
jgi:hypothetical protein